MSIAVSAYDQPIWIPVTALAPGGFPHWAASADVPGDTMIAWIDGLKIEGGGSDRGPEFRFSIPATAGTPAGFSEWAVSNEFPDRGRVSLLQQEIFIDMSPEELYKHSVIKGEIGRVLGTLVKQARHGIFYPDGALLRNDDAGLCTVPDSLFLTGAALESKQIEFQTRRGRTDECTEIAGTPDWVLEIVSRSSARKDKHVLRDLYHRAGIAEYWLIDALGDEIDFQILVHQPGGYTAAPVVDGWAQSPVFGRSFRLQRSQNEWGYWEYTLDVQE